MSGNGDYLFTDDALQAAARMGLLCSQLHEMVRRSARIAHPRGNRRYHDYLFLVVGRWVLRCTCINNLQPARMASQCPACQGIGKVPVFDACETCQGIGCDKCDRGLVPSEIPCPLCHSH